jgi:hypothetical protein
MRSSSAGLWVKRTAANSEVRSQKEMAAHLRLPFRRLRAGYSRWGRVCVVSLPEEPFVLTAPSRQPEGSCAAGRRSGAGRSSPREFPCRLRRSQGSTDGVPRSAVSARCPLNARAQLILLLYLDKRGRPKVRIHGRPRSDRKRSFLLSAVAPSTSTRHPREARPINWAQRGGLASGGEIPS